MLLEADGAEGNVEAGEDSAWNGAAQQVTAVPAAAGTRHSGASHCGAGHRGAGHRGTGPCGQAAGQAGAGDGLPDQVRRVRYTHCDGTRLPAATLVRPDGYLAWASDDRDAWSRARAARAAARWWCGPA